MLLENRFSTYDFLQDQVTPPAVSESLQLQCRGQNTNCDCDLPESYNESPIHYPTPLMELPCPSRLSPGPALVAMAIEVCAYTRANSQTSMITHILRLASTAGAPKIKA